MVGRKIDYNGVPTADLENNSNQKKYTINKGSSTEISISRPACALFIMGAIVMAAIAAVIAYFLAPGCSDNSLPSSLTQHKHRLQDEPLPVKYVRLPRSVIPLKYRLHIIPKLETDFTTWGNVTIALRITDKTDEILLNALDLQINKHSTRLRRLIDGEHVGILKQDYIQESQTYSVQVEKSLNPGEEYELFIEFEGKLSDHLVGFYRSHYVTRDNATKWLAITQFSPTDARRAFPCFDEPSFKANYTISIARTQNMSSLSNMPIKETTVISSDNIIWDTYQETPSMSSYLVAFIVHDFVSYQVNKNRSIAVWTRKDLISQAVYAADKGPEILAFLERYFNIKFPLPKLDMIALPDFGFGAMENWGLITFREQKLLLDRFSSTVENNKDIALTMAHELAHSYFGNLVTPKWWDDLWLKEGFSMYFQYLGTDHIHPEWKILEEFFYDVTCDAFEIDNLMSSKPIHLDVKESNDIRQVFDSLSYSKGASLVRMIANILGENNFKEGLRAFLTVHQFANADHDDLWVALTQEATKNKTLDAKFNMKEIMDGWIHQAGYPVVTVKADRENNKLTFTQKRFVVNADEKSKTPEKWTIPISYTSADNIDYEDAKPKLWLKGNDNLHLSLNLSNWYLLNLKQGYYIVNYDETNWKMLTENIMELPSVIRAQLVNDAMDLARAGLLDYGIPLDMMGTIGTRDKEIILVPLLTIFSKTDFLHNILYNTPAYGVYEKYFWYIFYFYLDKVDFVESPDDGYFHKSIRSLVLKQACRKRELKCAVTATQIYRTWMERNYHVPPNIRGVVYCTAIRDGDSREWDFAYREYLKVKSASERMTILKALGCSSKPWILARYLEMIISNTSGIRKQDGSIVFASVAENVHGHNLAFDFIRNKWNEINEYYGGGFLSVSRMIESLAKLMNAPYHLQQLELFRQENKYIEVTNRAFDNTIELVKTNIQWMKINYKSVESWLEQKVAYHRM